MAVLYNMVLLFQVRYWEELGFPEQKAARLYLFSGVSSLVIRPVIGRLHDVRWINPCYMYIAAAATEGVATLLLPLATTTSHFVVFFVVYGFADGTVGSGTSIAVLNILPERQRPLGFGVYLSITSVLSACGPALGGKLANSISVFSLLWQTLLVKYYNISLARQYGVGYNICINVHAI